MKLEYAVVSSNSNPEYLDFWPYVAKAWKNLIGLEPVLLYIDNSEPPAWVHEHGKVYYLVARSDWDIVQQSQCIRFWAANILDKPFIISDMDMLPISKDYYINHAEYIGDAGLISYSSDIIKYRWYRTNPQYPMCYLAGDPKSFSDVFGQNNDGNNNSCDKTATTTTTTATTTTATATGGFKNEQELEPRKTRSRAGFFVSPAARLDKATARLKNVLSRVRVADLQKSKGDPKPSAKLAAMVAAAAAAPCATMAAQNWRQLVSDHASQVREVFPFCKNNNYLPLFHFFCHYSRRILDATDSGRCCKHPPFKMNVTSGAVDQCVFRVWEFG